MFQRQWFDSNSQQGLKADAIRYDELLRRGRAMDAYALLRQRREKNPQYWERRYLQLKKVMHLKKISRKENYVCFSGFWPDFSCCDNQILDLLRMAFPGKVILGTTEIDNAVISFWSCYEDPRTVINSKDATLRVLFLGENVRPCYQHFDYSLTSDPWDYCDRNIYLPLWFIELDFLDSGKIYPDRNPYNLQLLYTERQFDYSKRLPRAVYIGNNAEPFRVSLMNYLEESGIPVDRFGSQSYPVDDKTALLQEYKLTICPENSIADGYITEKPMHSYVSGTVAIYRSGVAPFPLRIAESEMYISPRGVTQQSILRICQQAQMVINVKTKRSLPLMRPRDFESCRQDLICRIRSAFGWLLG